MERRTPLQRGSTFIFSKRDTTQPPSSAPTLRQLLPPGTPLEVHSDALTAAHAGRPGMVLVAGTGSICLARTAGDRIIRVGGRGPLVDDAGSARWIGRRALETAARQADGRLPGRTVLEAALAHYHAADIGALASAVHHAPSTQHHRDRHAHEQRPGDGVPFTTLSASDSAGCHAEGVPRRMRPRNGPARCAVSTRRQPSSPLRGLRRVESQPGYG